ncbi:MAG: hypothetical protein HRU20_31530 [Pseudomonadales bacterium]|nr:hypothetical protein [Pseudomonadales bacterium]
MKYLSQLPLLCMIAMLGACSSYLDISSTAYYQDVPPTSGRIYVKAADPAIAQSLEFQHYKTEFEIKFTEQGYTIVAESNAQMIAAISYGVEGANLTTSTSLQPSSGLNTSVRVGRSSRGRHGSVGISTGTGSTKTTSANISYSRFLKLDLSNVPENADEQSMSFYQITVKSQGKCANLTGVFKQMLFALFIQFPGESGKSIAMQVEGEEHC